MEDNFLNTEELERMLGPQCEFHASEGLKDKVMNEARAVSRPRRLRLIPWLAAACVAGILVIFLTPPKDSGTATSENVTAATTENVAATTSGSVAATTSKSSTVADIGQNGQQGSVKPKTAENPQKEKYIAAAPAKRKRTADGHAPKECRQTAATRDSLDNGQWATLISETDLPITCPENAKYTPEEIEQLKRQARQAYLNWIRLEIEIASHNLQQTANVN